MRAAAEAAWGEPTLHGRRVAISGVGKVGRQLVDHLLGDGATVVVSDVDADAVARLIAAHPEVAAADPNRLVDEPMDVYSPCALGHALTDETVARLAARIVCGGANNQLAHPGVEALLEQRGILYAPDYVVNAGGVIQVADEIHGYDPDRARAKASEIFTTTARIFATAAASGVPPSIAADHMAEARMASARGARR
jgi:valine dehydrogenase (NAD+)